MTVNNSTLILSDLWTLVYGLWDSPLVYMERVTSVTKSTCPLFWGFFWMESWKHNYTRWSSLLPAYRVSGWISPLSIVDSRYWTMSFSLSLDWERFAIGRTINMLLIRGSMRVKEEKVIIWQNNDLMTQL